MRAALLGLTGFALLGALCFAALVLHAEEIQRDLTERTRAAVAGLGADWAEVMVDGRDVRLFGTAPSDEAKAAALAAARGIDGVRRVGGRIRVDAVISPYVWRLERSPQQIVLSGFVPDPNSKRALHDLAQRTFGRPVQDQTRVARGVPEGDWLAAASFAIKQVALLRDGGAVLEDTALTLTGPEGQLDEDRAAVFEAAARDALVSPFEAKLAIFTPEAGEASEDGEPAPESAPAEPGRLSLALCQQRVDDLFAERAIVFPSGKRKPTEESLALIEDIASELEDCRHFIVEVAGHTDSTGKEKANRRLSEVRAKAVVEALVREGVPIDRLSAVGYGSSRPIADNATKAGRARNRRIEITVKTEVLAEN